MTEGQLDSIRSLDAQLGKCASPFRSKDVLGDGWEARWAQIKTEDANECIYQLKDALALERGY